MTELEMEMETETETETEMGMAKATGMESPALVMAGAMRIRLDPGLVLLKVRVAARPRLSPAKAAALLSCRPVPLMAAVQWPLRRLPLLGAG